MYIATTTQLWRYWILNYSKIMIWITWLIRYAEVGEGASNWSVAPAPRVWGTAPFEQKVLYMLWKLNFIYTLINIDWNKTNGYNGRLK